MRKGFPLAFTLVMASFFACAVPICADAACVNPPSGLISWWGGDNNALDIVGTNNGTIHGGITYGQGEVGRAFNFDGASGSYLQIPYSGDLNIQGSLSISAWVYIRNTSSTRLIAGKAGGTQLYCVDGILHFVVYIGGSPHHVVSTIALAGNSWHHVSGVFDGNAGVSRIYIDDVLNNTSPSIPGQPDTNVAPYEIGGFSEYACNLDGLIDEVAIFNQALTSQEVQNIYNTGCAGMCRPCVTPPADLVSWWGGDNNALDIVGTNHGTLNGATYAPGKVSQAFSFDGVDDSVVIPHNANQNTGSQITIAAWVNLTTSGHGRSIVQKRSSSNVGGYFFETAHLQDTPANTLTFCLWIGGEPQWVTAPADVLTPGAWHHVAATYDGANAKIYVDGEEKANKSISGSIDAVTDPITIGRNVVVPEFAWYGLIDEVEIFNRALSASEIVAIYNAGSSAMCRPSVPSPSGLISWWKGENSVQDLMGMNNGTMMNGATFDSGKVGQAFSFDGTDDYIDAGTSDAFNFNGGAGDFTIQAWIKLDSMPAFGSAILGKATHGPGGIFNGPYTGWAFYLYSDGRLAFGGAGAWEFFSPANTLAVGNWYHVAVTKNAGTYRLYSNGLEVKSSDYGNLQTSMTPLLVGSTYSDDLFFDGLIDEVAIFNRALTNGEIAAIYNSGSSGMTPFDLIPDAFTFTPITDAQPSTAMESTPVTVTGIDTPSPVTVTGGYYQINGGECTATSSTVNLGNSVAVCLTSADAYSTTTSATLTIGGVSGTFTVTTAPDLIINPVKTPTTLVSQTISGTVKSGAAVSVSVNSGPTQAAEVVGTVWSFNVTGLVRGDNSIHVSASDSWGYVAAKSATINCTAPQLTVTVTGTTGISGSGGGTLTSDPAAIACTSGPCAALFDGGSTVPLTASPDIDSIFGSWSGACAGISTARCDVTMDSDKTSAAAFTYVEPARIQDGPDYPHIADAYATLTGSGTILAREFLFTGGLNLGNATALVLKGGYNPAYTVNSAYSTIQGTLTVAKGSLTVERVIVK